MHKFYWNNTHRGGASAPHSGAPSTSGSTSSAVATPSGSSGSSDCSSGTGVKLSSENQSGSEGVLSSNSSESSTRLNMNSVCHPEVPLRANGGLSATIKIEQPRDQRATTPSGSHRVLLKLKKMGQNRPKSMHEENSSTDNGNGTTTTNANLPKKKLPASKSMHQFYNRTWNERSLSKYANQHNYENVYNNSPNYENIYFGGHFEDTTSNCEGCMISQLTCSPRSARARLNFDPCENKNNKQTPVNLSSNSNSRCHGLPRPQPDYHVPPVPPERKGRGRKRGQSSNQPHLFRSKSCERPKMRDTFRMDKFAANFNRISSNITDKLLSSRSSSQNQDFDQDDHQKFHDHSCREISNVAAHNSILQSVALRAIPCVDIQVRNSIFY